MEEVKSKSYNIGLRIGRFLGTVAKKTVTPKIAGSTASAISARLLVKAGISHPVGATIVIAIGLTTEIILQANINPDR